ncbi:YggT family protein [Notoacmeibacter ruber]|uniref:YggT family protein n=1 Tax=Notoacmeibacter ruber TaxID=2670375 RepID=A0A3L7JG00_9HYPH|nr:YggT family protein [Notoacmeibacter ruber]RLQ89613.1 YggT family protein [Notoacmeibacter ruber]
MQPVILTLLYALDIYKWIIIAMIVVSWLIAFDIINRRNRFVDIVWDFLVRVTEPALAPIRRFMPHLGGIDISPIILFIIIFFIQQVLMQILYSV